MSTLFSSNISSAMPVFLWALLLSFLSWCSKTAVSFKMLAPSRCSVLDFWPASSHTFVWIPLLSLVWRTLLPTCVPISSLVLPGVSSGLPCTICLLCEDRRSTVLCLDGLSVMCF